MMNAKTDSADAEHSYRTLVEWYGCQDRMTIASQRDVRDFRRVGSGNKQALQAFTSLVRSFHRRPVPSDGRLR